MTEWLESKLFRGWFWKEIWSNLRKWLGDAPVVVKALFWITGGLLIWLPAVGYFFEPESTVHNTGVALQLLGFICAAYGLEKTLEKFGRVPSISRVFPWLTDFGEVFDTARKAKGAVQGSPAKMTMTAGTGEVILDEDTSLSERVEQLEERLDEVEDELHARIDEEVERLEEQIEKEQKVRQEKIDDLQETLEEVNVGDITLGLEWWGVSFLIYGLLLSSFPWFFQPVGWVLLIPILIGALVGGLDWGLQLTQA